MANIKVAPIGQPNEAPIGGTNGDTPGNTLSGVISLLGNVQGNVARIVTHLQQIVDVLSQAGAHKEDYTKETVQLHHNYLATDDQQVRDVMAHFSKRLSAGDPQLRDFNRDLTIIDNQWEDITAVYPTNLADKLATKKPEDIKTALGLYQEFYKHIVLFTVPRRIRPLVREGYGVGSEFDFHNEFQEEIPNQATRILVLKKLAGKDPAIIGGMVDLDNGIIYRVATDKVRRVITYLILALIAIAGWVVVDALSVNGAITVDLKFDAFSQWSKTNGWSGFDGEKPYGWGELLLSYITLILGLLVHIVKKAIEFSGAAKERVTEGRATLEGLVLWIHARERWFWGRVGIAIVGYIMLVIFEQATWVNTFLLAYFLDSFADVIMAKVQKKVLPDVEKTRDTLLKVLE
jgi:hypothetical protein